MHKDQVPPKAIVDILRWKFGQPAGCADSVTSSQLLIQRWDTSNVSRRQAAAAEEELRTALSGNATVIVAAFLPRAALNSEAWRSWRQFLLAEYRVMFVVELPEPPNGLLVIASNEPQRGDVVFASVETPDELRELLGTRDSRELDSRQRRVSQQLLKPEVISAAAYDPARLEFYARLAGMRTKRLGELASLYMGVRIDRQASAVGNTWRLVSGRSIASGSLDLAECSTFDTLMARSGSVERAMLVAGDIILPHVSRHVRPVLVPEITGLVADATVIVIRGPSNPFLFRLFAEEQTRDLLYRQIADMAPTLGPSSGSAPAMTFFASNLSQVLIPLPLEGDPNVLAPANLVLLPPEVVRRIATEIDVKSAAIGAKFEVFLVRSGSAPEMGSATSRGEEFHRPADPPLASPQTEFSEFRQECRRSFEGLYHIVRSLTADVRAVSDKLDTVLAIVRETSLAIAAIRREQRSIEERLLLIGNHYDRMALEIRRHSDGDLKVYGDYLQRVIASWTYLEPLSREFLVMAEYLFSRLQGEFDLDFSPAILQYCRSLEHELGSKTFLAFISAELERATDEVSAALVETKHENFGVQVLAKQIARVQRGGVGTFTLSLGQMREILYLALGRETVQSSILLQRLRDFVQSDDHRAAKLSKELVKGLDLGTIVDELRNPCAHPHKLTLSDAERCKGLIPPAIDRYLGYVS